MTARVDVTTHRRAAMSESISVRDAHFPSIRLDLISRLWEQCREYGGFFAAGCEFGVARSVNWTRGDG
jgi:hypothetical protein